MVTVSIVRNCQGDCSLITQCSLSERPQEKIPHLRCNQIVSVCCVTECVSKLESRAQLVAHPKLVLGLHNILLSPYLNSTLSPPYPNSLFTFLLSNTLQIFLKNGRGMDGCLDGQATCFQRQFYEDIEGEHQIGKSSLGKGAIGVNRDFHNLYCLIFIIGMYSCLTYYNQK